MWKTLSVCPSQHHWWRVCTCCVLKIYGDVLRLRSVRYTTTPPQRMVFHSMSDDTDRRRHGFLVLGLQNVLDCVIRLIVPSVEETTDGNELKKLLI